MDVRRELIEVEERFWRAAGDRDRYAEHLAADAIHVFPGWGVASREAVLSGVAEAETWKTFTIEDPEVMLAVMMLDGLEIAERLSLLVRREGSAW